MLLGSVNTTQNSQVSLALTFTATVASGATSATLSASWNPPTGAYTVIFSDGEQRQVTLTNGATTATWVGGLTSSVSSSFTALVNGGVGAITTATALPANPQRTGWQIQNQSTNALYVTHGPSGSTSNYNYILKACTGTADGTGGSFAQFSGTVYNGIVTVSGTNPSYSVLEVAP